MKDSRKALHSSETNEWYTPTDTISIVRAALGGIIELDPCSNDVANEVVRAHYWFDEWDDGLRQPWHAETLFMNPPYGRDEETSKANAHLWIAKFLREYKAGHFGAGIILVNATTDSAWFEPLWEGWISFQYSRIRFWRAGSKAKQPTHGSVLAYFGDEPASFVRAIGDTGHVVPARKLYTPTIEEILKLAA
jgi:hypothetical protein